MRERAAGRPSGLARTSALGLGLGYLALTGALLTAAPRVGPQTLAVAAALVALYAVAYRTEFVSTTGSAVPTEPVLVAMLLTLPLPVVPLAVLAGVQLGGIGSEETGSRWTTLLVRTITGWHCLGPVTVLALAGDPAPSLAHAPVYLVALLAQFGVDAAVGAVRAVAHEIPLHRLVGPLSWTFAVDALLAPIGLCVVLAGAGSPFPLALLAAPVGLVRLLARDRSQHLAAAVTLTSAYTTVQEEARVDALTGLANRRAWDEALAAATDLVRSDPSRRIRILVADLDGLKQVNDTHGHDTGDALIRAMGDVLCAAVPGALLVARLGGDEYGVVVVGAADDALDDALLTDVRSALRAHPGVAGQRLSASLGVAACPPAASPHDAALAADELAASDKRERRVGRR